MRATPLALCLLFSAGAAHAQADLGNIFRSLSGSLRGKEAQQPAQQQGVTPVMGLRGIDEVNGAKPAAGGGEKHLLQIDNWAATRASAERAAADRRLAARAVTLRDGTGADGERSGQ